LTSFNERYGPYPYSELDIVSTPTQALGVEYPGIFANALRIYDLSAGTASGLPNAAYLESVTAHETAHQWFYNLVGNDQLNEPWLDEATAQYATWMYYVDRYGEQNADGYYQSLLGRWERTEFADIPIGMPAEDYDGQEYGSIVYGRGPIFLDELAQEMGQETFDAFMRDYSETYRWEIATSEDFQALAEQHCQCDLAAMFDEAVYAN
jgi:aminopeptidase N